MSEIDRPGEVREIITIRFSTYTDAESKNDALNNLKVRLRSICRNFQDFWTQEYRNKYPVYTVFLSFMYGWLFAVVTHLLL
jgi:hypothetical protein